MSTRGVNINFPTPDPRVVDWLEANNIDPRSIPVAQEILVTDEHMAYVGFIFIKDGRKVVGSYGYLKEIKVVPLIAAPENFGL